MKVSMTGNSGWSATGSVMELDLELLKSLHTNVEQLVVDSHSESTSLS
ncbi:MAG: hypothetical protein JSS82_15750 [Bacteroidetes bacterium]|nr:hypothetical protein [Bacteroidota bacterium]